MLRIAVIDDDKTLLCDMHKLFDRFIIAYDFDFIVEYFSSCEDIYTLLSCKLCIKMIL